MKQLHAACGVVAFAALFAGAAMAQTPGTTTVTTTVHSASGVPVTSGTGIQVTPGVAVTTHQSLPGATLQPAGTTTVTSAPNTTTTVTSYWANVPAGVQNDGNFQRWQALR